VTPPPPDDALTAVTRRPQPHTSRWSAFFLGLATAICPAIAGYYAYRQARVESGAETKNVRETADIGYQTLVQTMTLMQGAVREFDARLTWVEQICREQKEHVSLPDVPPTPPPTQVLVPLQRAKLFRALPQTLDRAAVEAR